jgi:hypothetical protein
MWSLLLAGAGAAELDVVCRPDGEDELLLVGLPPFEIRCTASLPDGTLADDTEWLFGDGTTGSGAAVAHVYEKVGRYPLAAFASDVATSDTGLPTDYARRGQVTVCGEPRPRFETHFRGGLMYRFTNLTPPDPGCLSELRWDLFEGEGQQGESLQTSTTWDAQVEVPEKGKWTMVLSIGGIGGVAASAVTLDADGGLTDAYAESAFAGCNTAPLAPWWVAAVALAGLRRRR